MKGYLVPLALALLLAAPAVWRLGGAPIEGEEMEQAADDGQEISKTFAVTSYELDGKLNASTVAAEMPRVPDTAELLKIDFPTQGN